MQVILMERIEKLGQMGEVVTVKPGYARNYLLLGGLHDSDLIILAGRPSMGKTSQATISPLPPP